jgi:hypothetical protein
MHTKVNSCAKAVKIIKSQQPHFVILTVLQSNLACGELTLCVTTRERGNENNENNESNLSRIIAITFFAAVNSAYGFTETKITGNRNVS